MISESQLEKLSSLLREIQTSNPFYQKKLAGISGPILTSDQLRSIPFTFKRELVQDQEQYPPFGSNLTYPIETYTRFHQTSGTSGTPIRWLDTPESWEWMTENWKQVFLKAGARPADRFFFAFSFGPFLGFWLAFEAAEKIGGLCIPGGGLSSLARLKMIVDHRATVLCCTPTYALRLAEVSRSEGVSLRNSHVRLIVVAGEPGGSIPEVRSALESAWPKARVFDHHGMTEVGPVSYQCPESPDRLHVLGKSYLPEIIDSNSGDHLLAGQIGELVLTPLGRAGTPLVRYRTGDLVRTATRSLCNCPVEDLSLEGGILGRCDDMVVIRGVNIYPSAVEKIVRAVPGIVEFKCRVVKSATLAEMEVQIEPDLKADGNRLADELARKFEVAFSLRIPVKSVAPGSLPRFELKSRRWVVEAKGSHQVG